MKNVFLVSMEYIPVQRAVELYAEGYEFTPLENGYVLVTKGGLE